MFLTARFSSGEEVGEHVATVEGSTFSHERVFQRVRQKCLSGSQLRPWGRGEEAQISLGLKGGDGGWPEGLITWTWIKNYNNSLIHPMNMY